MKHGGVKPASVALSAALLTGWAGAGCASPADDHKSSEQPTTSTTSTTSAAATTSAEPEAPDVRADAAMVMMVGVRDYADARHALALGAGGIFIGSWTDPSLLGAEGNNIAALRAEFPRPFAVAIDAEGGRVVRQASQFGALPAPRVMAETMSPEQVRGVAFDLGSRLKAAGVTVDFAPVVDVDAGPAGGAIGDRSFSGDPQVAATYAAAFGQGLLDAGVTPVFKHFPGHGHSTGDSHTNSVFTPPLAQLEQQDLIPYGTVLAMPGAAAMVGHMIVPDFGDPHLPSTLDPAIYGLLRSGTYPGGVPFAGVVYTDDLSGMRAVADTYSTPEAVTGAIAAGADVALWISTAQLEESVSALEEAVAQGRVPQQKLAQSAAKVREAATWALR